MVKVRMKAMAITSQYGTLSSGDILVTNEEFANHLVNECNAAEYITEKQEEKETKQDKK